MAITVLLALFAGGDGGGLAADIEAREVRNQLIETETAKLGTKQLKANLKLKDSAKSQFSFSDGGEVVDTAGEWGGGGGGGAARPAQRQARDAPSIQPQLPRSPGQSVTIAGAEGVPDGAKHEADRAKKTPKKQVDTKPVTEPTKDDLDRAMEASRQRSNGGDAGPGED